MDRLYGVVGVFVMFLFFSLFFSDSTAFIVFYMENMTRCDSRIALSIHLKLGRRQGKRKREE
jgi:hypothetical protein